MEIAYLSEFVSNRKKILILQNRNLVSAESSALEDYIPEVEKWEEVYLNDVEGYHVKVTNEYMQRLWDILQSISISEVTYIDVSELSQSYQYRILIQGEDGTIKGLSFNETEGMFGHRSGNRG